MGSVIQLAMRVHGRSTVFVEDPRLVATLSQESMVREFDSHARRVVCGND
jgi:hypothetical protein